MSIEAIKQEIANMDTGNRNDILAYIIAMNDLADAEYQAALTRKLNDKDPSRWVSLEEIERRFLAEGSDGAKSPTSFSWNSKPSNS